MMKRLAGFGVLMGVLALAPGAEAAPILGGISFAGKATEINPDWSASTGANFTNPWSVTSTTGDYSSVPTSTPATFAPSLSWGSGSGNVNTTIGPLTLWSFTVGGLTYTLTVGTIGTINRGSFGNISVLGTGTLTITGGSSNYDPTPGTWSFTGANKDILTFTSSAAAVPEPGSMILLGTGLFGLGAAARRRWAKKA